MKSLDRAIIIVSDTLKTETSLKFYFLGSGSGSGSGSVSVSGLAPDSGFQILAFPYARKALSGETFCFLEKCLLSIFLCFE